MKIRFWIPIELFYILLLYSVRRSHIPTPPTHFVFGFGIGDGFDVRLGEENLERLHALRWDGDINVQVLVRSIVRTILTILVI